MLSTAEQMTMLSPQLLHLIVMPTEACNFRCLYCYEDFRLAQMEESIVRGIEQLLESRMPNLQQLTLSWFGGEPLVARNVVRRLLIHVRNLRLRYPACTFQSEMTTNGYRLDRLCLEELVSFGVSKYQISFDGVGSVHDAKRQRADGRGTFEKIWANLEACYESERDFTVMLRLHVAKDNLESCLEFVQQARQTFGADARFPLFPKLLARWGGPNDRNLPTLGRMEGNPILEKVRALARQLGLPLYEPGHATPCYAAQANSFLIRADGRVNKCTLALDAPENQVGRLESDGRLRLNGHLMTPWMRGIWSGSVSELRCPKTELCTSHKGLD